MAISFSSDALDDLISYSPEPEQDTSTFDDYKSRDTFLQKENCFATSELLPQCHECEKDPMTNKYNCRFFEFRKIERINGVFKVAGFLDPDIDPNYGDLDLWTTSDSEIDRETADYILSYVAAQFCEISEDELNINKSNALIAWKRSMPQVREICDVCDTSVFNFHWTCTHCGTCVCIDCDQERKQKISRWKPKTKADKEERDSFFWLKCHDHNEHQMMLTQMTTGDALLFLNNNLHTICDDRNITQKCGCSLSTKNCVRMQSKRILLEQPIVGQPNNLELRQIMKRQRQKAKPSRRLSLMEQQRLQQNVKLTYVARNRILKLLEPSESLETYKIFQQHWERGLPVVVANVTDKMQKIIWSPEYFSQRFGNEKHVMINCQNNVAINRVAMKFFWDGFGSIKKRLPRENDEKVVLKLKDWPTSDDFANVMKEHFDDLMGAVPLSAYTTRNGRFNLASYLPEHFSRPDLGPKMYSAYCQLHPTKQGSTNLHLDVSDAINILVHVSQPSDHHLSPKQYSVETMKQVLDEAGADEADKRNVLSRTRLPGAVWHIYPAHQADDMRKILYDVAIERGKPLGVNDDPVHDQDWFIDSELRQRFMQKGIEEFTIVQYEGDAVFIPAGAPHQVRNLSDCIKVALDFVAPENLSECLNLTEEFRILSERHQNHEDKLQIKNILYHCIKNLVPARPDL